MPVPFKGKLTELIHTRLRMSGFEQHNANTSGAFSIYLYRKKTAGMSVGPYNLHPDIGYSRQHLTLHVMPYTYIQRVTTVQIHITQVKFILI